MQPADKLVMMANQIAKNLAIQGEEQAISGIANHIRSFWDQRMRAAIAAHVVNGGKGLDPLAKKAIEGLPAPAMTQNS